MIALCFPRLYALLLPFKVEPCGEALNFEAYGVGTM